MKTNVSLSITSSEEDFGILSIEKKIEIIENMLKRLDWDFEIDYIDVTHLDD